jgi:hypothetical protein
MVMDVNALLEPYLVEEITEIARQEGQSPANFVTEAVQRHVAHYRQKRILAETNAWYQMPAERRRQYAGQFVAVLGGEVVDRDSDRLALFQRTHKRFGREPVLIVEGGDQPMPTYRVTSVIRS